MIGFTAGEIPTVKVNRLLLGNKSAVGVGWGEYWMTNPGYLQKQWTEVEPLLAAGKLDPLVGAEFPLEEATAALELTRPGRSACTPRTSGCCCPAPRSSTGDPVRRAARTAASRRSSTRPARSSPTRR